MFTLQRFILSLQFIGITVIFFTGLTAQSLAITMKVDRVTVNTPLGGSPTWTSVTFQQAFPSTPVVVVSPTNNNSGPASVRIRNVTTTGFDVSVVEPPGEDGQTAAMQVDYFAAEPGTYTFAGAVRVVVGSLTTTTQQGRFIAGASWDTINFPGGAFSTAPAVITQVQTINSQPTLDAGITANPWLEVAVRNVSAINMQIALERAETNTGTVAAETIGYVAMESGNIAAIAGQTLQALRTGDNIRGWDSGCFANNYGSGFSSTPLIIASQNTRDGGDGGWVRRCSVSSTSVGLTIDEDQDNDSERSHTTERAGVLGISGAFHGIHSGQHMEAGSTTISSTAGVIQWTAINFPNAFTTTPLIFALPTNQGSSPASIRLRNISSTGFEMAAIQSPGGSGAHPQMDVDYIAIEPGEHLLPNGDVFEVGSISTAQVRSGVGGSTGWATINFTAGYSAAPAVLLQVQTINNEPGLNPNIVSSPWLVTAATGLNSSQILTALERAETSSGSVSSPETIAYFAVRNTANGQFVSTIGNTINYEMLRSANTILGWDNGCYTVNFSDTYSTPHAIATQNTRNGGNGGWIRRCNLQSSSIGLQVDEDQANDSERSHIGESASVFVFSQAFEAAFGTADHYAIAHSGSGVTCEAETVTITAHDTSHIAVAAGSNIRISATSSTAGWNPTDANWSLLAGTLANFSPGPGAGQASYQFASGETQVVLALSNISEADIDIDVLDTIDGSTSDPDDGGAEDPLLAFVDSGLRFYADIDGDGDADDADSNGIPDPIPSPLTAGDISPQMLLRAVEKNSDTGACTARVAGGQSVLMAYECLDPTTCIRDKDLSISGTAIEENNLGSVAAYQTVALTFDTDGEAPFTLQYFDVGAIRLHAQLPLAASGADPAVTLTGNSGNTIVKPADLVVTTIETLGGTSNPGTGAAGSGFVAAGTPFRTVVEVRNSQGGLTPNFGNEMAAEALALMSNSLVMPAGGNNPVLSSAASFTNTATAGEFENSAVNWREVGTIRLNAVIADSDYMGTGNVLGTTTGNVGRFYPLHLRLLSSSVENGCPTGGFTYMSDQAFSYKPVDIAYTLRAEYQTGSTVTNYDTALGYPVDNLNVVAENDNQGTDIVARAFVPGATWIQGEYLVAGLDNGGFRRLFSGGEIADGPYNSVQLGLRVGTSPDPSDFEAGQLTMNASTTGDCVAAANCDAVPLGSPLNSVFGRFFTHNAHGPESAPLAVPFETQYWNGSKFVTQSADSCTTLARSDIRFASNAITSDPIQVTVGSGTSTATFSPDPTGSSTISFASGSANLQFSAPGIGNTGFFLIELTMGNYPWLRDDWNQNNDATDDNNQPTAEIHFGSYRGHDRIIYWQEVMD